MIKSLEQALENYENGLIDILKGMKDNNFEYEIVNDGEDVYIVVLPTVVLEENKEQITLLAMCSSFLTSMMLIFEMNVEEMEKFVKNAESKI